MPEEIIQSELSMRTMALGQEALIPPILKAWDALVYDQYEPRSLAESSAGFNTQVYYHRTREPTIKLSDPQIRILDALTEAVGIPHERGQTEIEIPEKLRNYNKYSESKEHHRRIDIAEAARAAGITWAKPWLIKPKRIK